MINMKPKDVTKLGIAELDKSEKHPEENALREDGLYRYINLVNNLEILTIDFMRSKNTYMLTTLRFRKTSYWLYLE